MMVCSCQNVTLDDIVNFIERYGHDPETIKEKAEIGKGCEECLNPACESVDLPWPYAMMNAEAMLKQR